MLVFRGATKKLTDPMAKTAPTQNWSPKLLGKIPRRFHRPEVLSWKKRSRLSRRMDGFDPQKFSVFWETGSTNEKGSLGGVFKDFYCHPYLGKWSNLTNIFQLGWIHQPVVNRFFWRRKFPPAERCDEFKLGVVMIGLDIGFRYHSILGLSKSRTCGHFEVQCEWILSWIVWYRT